MNPIKAAERMVKWLQAPLDPNPPAFAVETESFGKKSKM